MTTTLNVLATLAATAWVVWFICHLDGMLLQGRTRPRPRRHRYWGRLR